MRIQSASCAAVLNVKIKQPTKKTPWLSENGRPGRRRCVVVNCFISLTSCRLLLLLLLLDGGLLFCCCFVYMGLSRSSQRYAAAEWL